MKYTPISDAVFRVLRHELGEDIVLTSKKIESFGRDESGLYAQPEAVVFADSSEHVSTLLRLANEHNFAVTPRGTGTGLAGGVCPVRGGVVLSMERMNSLLEIDAENLVARVHPGVITQDVRNAARAQGLFYPPDPASLATSSIGGNAATNAGGNACVKYGVTRDYVLGLKVVLPTGQAVRTGVRTRKGVVGYDLTHLIVGSEGTLGVITELTLKLVPHPPAVAGLTAAFSGMEAAMRCVTQILVRGHLPSALEFLDHRCLELVGNLLPFSLPGETPSLLILETDGPQELITREIKAIETICRECGATEFIPAPTDEAREKIWDVRRQVSTRVHESSAIYMPEDVAVPIGSIAQLVAMLPAVEKKYGLTIYAFGHAGDGNIHLNFTAPSASMTHKMEQAITDVFKKVLALGGTISGEHGVGTAKMRFLPMEISQDSIALQRALKNTFDPNMILNPGKIFPER